MGSHEFVQANWLNADLEQPEQWQSERKTRATSSMQRKFPAAAEGPWRGRGRQ